MGVAVLKSTHAKDVAWIIRIFNAARAVRWNAWNNACCPR
jgi:hypothetical protein